MSDSFPTQLELKLDTNQQESAATVSNRDQATNIIDFAEAIAAFRDAERTATIRRIISLKEEIKEG